MSRVWVDGSGLPLDANNLNAMEADILAARSAHGTVNEVSVGAIRVAPGVDSAYSAFPSVCVRKDESLYMVWRQGTDHVSSHDGKIYSSTSSDGGLTWTAEVQILSDTLDLRDPGVSMSADQSTMYLTYFKEDTSSNPAGVFFRTSSDQGVSWSGETRVDPSYVYAASTAPVVILSGGSLMCVFYAKAAGTEAYYSCYASISSNGGSSWGTPTKFADGVAIGQDMEEPYAAVIGSNVIVAHRYGGAANIGITKSTNSGSTWGTPTSVFAGEGRSSLLATSAGTLVCVYRANPSGAATTQHGYVSVSHDEGTTWIQPRLVERANGGAWNYCGLIQNTNQTILCVNSVEVSSTSSTLSCRYLIEGNGISPYGDIGLSRKDRVANHLSAVAAIDSFDREDGAIVRSDDGVLWTVPSGPAISGGCLRDTTSTVANQILLDSLSNDQDVECEVMWASGSAVSGIYIILRWQDANNYLMAGVETSGANGRVYAVVSGTATQLGTTASLSMPAGYWHRLRFSAIQNNLRFYFEDSMVVSTSSGDFVGTQSVCGLRTGSTVAGTDLRARNFIARRRSGVNS